MSYLGTNSIGKLFLGSTQIGKAYLGSQLVYQYGSGPTPPTPTTDIPYIRNTGTDAYINTGITPSNNTRIIVWARNFNPRCLCLFGSQAAVNDSAFVLSTYTETSIGRIRVDYASSIGYADDQFSNLSHYHKYELKQGKLYVDDVLIYTTTDSNFSNNYPIHLFGCNRGGSHISMWFPADICACQIYNGSTKVRDFTPVSTPSVGLYDSVSDTVFTNAGSGTLTYGEFTTGDYTPLEYIGFTGAQYIDTEIYGTASLNIAIKFMFTGASVGSGSLFGAMRSGTGSSYFLAQTNGTMNKVSFLINSTSPLSLYSNNTTNILVDKDIVFYKDGSSAELVRNNAVFGNRRTFSVGSSFITPDTLYLGTLHYNEGVYDNGRILGRIYYAGFGAERNFVPAKVEGVAGFYDTYNDEFYPSLSGTDFVAGPEL